MPLNIARDKFCQQLMTRDSPPVPGSTYDIKKHWHFAHRPHPTARVVSKKNSTTLLEVCGIFADFATGEPAKPPIFSASPVALFGNDALACPVAALEGLRRVFAPVAA